MLASKVPGEPPPPAASANSFGPTVPEPVVEQLCARPAAITDEVEPAPVHRQR